MVRPASFFLALFVAMAAGANEQLIRRAIEPRLNGAKIEAVQPSPIPGLMEVRFRTPQGIQILYSDPKGENIVQGRVDPDEFYVHKPTFRDGFRCVLRRSLGRKQQRMVYATVDAELKSGAIHALSIKSYTPAQWQVQQSNG